MKRLTIVIAAAVISGPAYSDQVILDDLIVDGSSCVGFDCVNGEPFGFDTIRLKENNLRIKFEDTSTAGSFPSNDWQITANDSANGGANKFSIDDISGSRTPFTIEAGAPSHSLYVDDGGRVGIGTNTPVVELHIKDGDTPTVRLEQDGSSGWSPQTWDVAGNETNFFIRDASNGSTLPFRIRPGAPSSAIDVAGDGDVGVGTASPDASLHVRRTDGTAQIKVEETSAGEETVLALINNGKTRFAVNDTSASNQTWTLDTQSNVGFSLSLLGTGSNEFLMAPNGNLTILGSLISGGPTCGAPGCDALFQNEIETIEQHAAFMWENSYLREVGPTVKGAPWNVTEKTGGILSELEKAHIYIEQLNTSVKQKDAKIDQLNARLARLEQAFYSAD